MSAARHIDTETLLSFIGTPSTNAALDDFLTRHRIYDRPATFEQLMAELDEDERNDEEFREDTIARRAENSLIVESERLGCCLIFEARAKYEQLFDPVGEPGLFILKEIVFYAQGVQGYQGYPGTLPGNVHFGDMKGRVASVLHCRPTVTRRIYDMLTERYECRGWILNAGYGDGNQLQTVHLRRPHRYDRLAQCGAPPEIRDTKTTALLLNVLGRPRSDPLVEAAFARIGVDADQAKPRFCPDTVADLAPTKGITLFFRDGSDLPGTPGDPDAAWFVGVCFKRCGDLGSAGYWGELPMGLAFHDSAARILEKVGKAPDEQGTSDQLGHYMWKFDRYILHAMHSLIDDQLYRVTLFAPILAQELFG